MGALVLSGILESLLVDVSPADPLAFAATAGLLTTVGLVATWLPARRASGIDPTETIRGE